MDERQSAFDKLSDWAGIIAVAVTFITWPAALIIGLVRLAVYSMSAQYVRSLCDSAAYVSKFDTLSCVIHTSWFTFNKIATWLLLASDASMAIVLIGVVLSAIVLIAGLLFTALAILVEQ